jgi:hypothetical protein
MAGDRIVVKPGHPQTDPPTIAPTDPPEPPQLPPPPPGRVLIRSRAPVTFPVRAAEMPSDLPPPPPGRVRVIPAPPTVIENPIDKARKIIAYHLIWLLIGVIALSGFGVFFLLLFGRDEASDTILRWMGLALGPVGALVGSAVTFYMANGSKQ